MKNKYLTISLFLIMLLVSSYLVSSQVLATYEFDRVNVLYAAEFTAMPVEGVDSPNTWVNDIVGDDNRITVTYGVVELISNGEVLITEEFIRVEGENGFRRFLLNSGSYSYYEGTSNLMQAASFFWSAKKLEGTNVVKDFTPPVYSATLIRNLDEQGNTEAFSLSFSNDGEAASQTFRTPTIMYEADMGSIRESGAATARSEG